MVRGPPAARDTYSAASSGLRDGRPPALRTPRFQVAQQLAALVGDDGGDADRSVRRVVLVVAGAPGLAEMGATVRPATAIVHTHRRMPRERVV